MCAAVRGNPATTGGGKATPDTLSHCTKSIGQLSENPFRKATATSIGDGSCSSTTVDVGNVRGSSSSSGSSSSGSSSSSGGVNSLWGVRGRRLYRLGWCSALPSLALVFLSCVVLNSYSYMPFRREKGEAYNEDVEKETDELSFKAAFYLGLGLGSLFGGWMAHWSVLPRLTSYNYNSSLKSEIKIL